MSTNIEIRKTDSGAEVSFPFQIKDEFRGAFPSAKWSPSRRVWTVGPRSLKRLESWADQVRGSGVLEALSELESAELSEREVARLNENLDRVRAETERSLERARVAALSKREHEALLGKLEKARGGLEEAREAARTAEAETEAAQARIEERISHITTRAEIERLRDLMLRNYIPKAYAGDAFKRAQAELREIDDRLEEIGVFSDALRRAVNANHNRRDRDRDKLFGPVLFRSAG